MGRRDGLDLRVAHHPHRASAAILVLGSGAFEVAALHGLELGATLLVGLVAGAWVDRLRRRPVPLFVLDELKLGPAVLGLVARFGGASSFIGAIVASRASRRWGIGPVAIAAMLLSAIGNAFIPLAPAGLPLLAIGCLVMQQLVADSAVTVYDITEASARQTLVRDRALGRVSSTFHVAAGLAQLVATFGAGLLAEAIGFRATSWLAPLGGLLAALILWRSPVRTLLVLPERPVEEGGPAVNPLAAAAAAARASERDQPVGG